MKGLKVFHIYLFVLALPLNILYAQEFLLPEEIPPSYTPSGPVCIMEASYMGESNNVVTGDCWVYKPNTGWVFRDCEHEPVCINPHTRGDLGVVVKDLLPGKTEKSDTSEEEETFSFWNPDDGGRLGQVIQSQKAMALNARVTADVNNYMLQAVSWMREWTHILPESSEDAEKWLLAGQKVFSDLYDLIKLHRHRAGEHRRSALSSNGNPMASFRNASQYGALMVKLDEMLDQYVKDLFRIYVHGLSSKIGWDITKKIENVFSEEDTSFEEKIKKIRSLAAQVEPRIRNTPKQSGLLLQAQPASEVEGILSESLDEDLIQIVVQKGEMDVYHNALEMMKQHAVRKEEKFLNRELLGNPNAYDLTQVIGYIAKKRGFKGIVAPSAPDRTSKGINFISFKEFVE